MPKVLKRARGVARVADPGEILPIDPDQGGDRQDGPNFAKACEGRFSMRLALVLYSMIATAMAIVPDDEEVALPDGAPFIVISAKPIDSDLVRDLNSQLAFADLIENVLGDVARGNR